MLYVVDPPKYYHKWRVKACKKHPQTVGPLLGLPLINKPHLVQNKNYH